MLRINISVKISENINYGKSNKVFEIHLFFLDCQSF